MTPQDFVITLVVCLAVVIVPMFILYRINKYKERPRVVYFAEQHRYAVVRGRGIDPEFLKLTNSSTVLPHWGREHMIADFNNNAFTADKEVALAAFRRAKEPIVVEG